MCYPEVILEATEMCSLWGVEAKLKDTRVAKKIRDELCKDSRLIHPHDHFREIHYHAYTLTEKRTSQYFIRMFCHQQVSWIHRHSQ